MIKGFKDFLLRGNVVDLAVAVVIGAAFTAVVTSFTESFLRPLIGLAAGGGRTGASFEVNGQTFAWGDFLNALVTFMLTAAVSISWWSSRCGSSSSGAGMARNPDRWRRPRWSCWSRSATCCAPSRDGAPGRT